MEAHAFNKKALIAVFSRSGENWVDGGRIANLEIGNTMRVAQTIAMLTHATIFEIERAVPYPKSCVETGEVAKKELAEQARPAIIGFVPEMSSYEVVFLGFPMWSDTFPMVIGTFLESYDFSGKVIVPFATHEGGGLGSCVSDIQKLAPKSRLLPALSLVGHRVTKSELTIRTWLKKVIDLLST